MNIFLQIGLGLLPATVVTIILFFARKAFNFKKIFITLILTIACGALMTIGISKFVKSGFISSNISQEDMIAFVNALLLEEAYDEASEVIDQYSEEYGYDDDCRLLNARIKFYKGDYEAAYGLYRYLCGNTNCISDGAAEVVFAEEKLSVDSSDLVTIEYIQNNGGNLEDYGYTETSYENIKAVLQSSADDVKKDIEDEIEDEYSISGSIRDCAEAVAGVSEAYTDILDDGQNITGKYKRTFNSIKEDNPEFLNLICVKKARIKANVLAGDYDAITEELDSNSTYHELMISSELYMSGLVKKSAFPDEYRQIDENDAADLKSQISKIYRKNKGDLSVQDRKSLKLRVDAISNQLDDAPLVTIKEKLIDAAEEEADTDRTKVYLELAKIENYFGNETSTDSYISEAIYSSQDCEDDSYVAAMADIITVINNDSDTENIKSVSEYVDTVLDNSLTIDVESIISPEHQSYADTSSDSSGEDDENYESDDLLSDFAQVATDYVSRVKSAISIGKIDTADFENITARVQIDSDYITDTDELKDSINVYDCSAEITDFTLSKIEYSESNIILVCDVSGSMDGNMQDLREAVTTFVTDKNEDENVSIVTFDDIIVGTKEFGTSDEELISYAESMTAGGGTDMFSAVVECLDDFPDDKNANNVLILMTDGQDNNPKSVETIYSEIGELATENNVLIYTMGIGTEVDTSYLTTIAESGGGEFVYISDSSSLTSFYDMLHSQMYSQYELKYTALDTLTASGRTLEVTLPSENLRDIKTYSLEGYDDYDEENALQFSQDISAYGISPGYIYKSKQDEKVSLKGSGFKKDSTITVKLNGNIDYTVDVTYVDEETYSIIIPSGIAVGNYNVEVVIDGKKKIFANGFSVVVQGDNKTTTFGPYVFTSSEQIQNSDGSYTLRGAVTLNGWLHFKGDVTLTGDLDASSIGVSDYSGSYVEFYESTAEGFATYLAEKNIALYIPSLGDFTLYNDWENQYDYSKYLVEDIPIYPVEFYGLVRGDDPVIRLYPNSIGMYFSTGTTLLPYQDKIFTSYKSDTFSFKFDSDIQITDKNVEFQLDLDYSDPSESYRTINFLNSNVYFNGGVKVKIDTLNDEYVLGAMIGLAFFEKASGIGAEIEWKKNLIPDSVTLKVKKKIALPTTIPITIDNFSFGVSNINDALSKDSILEGFGTLEFVGTASLSSLKIKDYFPGIGKVVGDLSVLSMPDTSATLRCSPFKVEVEAELDFLSEIKLAQAKVQLGTFNYTNSLLGIDGESVSGLSASLTTGLMCNMADGRVSINISGTGEFDAHTRFVGTVYNGTIEYDIGWWIIHSEEKISGDVAFGLYTTHDDKLEVVFVYKYTDKKGKIKGAFYYIDEDGNCGNDNGKLS